MLFSTFDSLKTQVISCARCPRLVCYREEIGAITHWGKPVPGFGDPKASLLILGIAPSIQGGNRTGRLFTGDGSARFLIRMLYKAGFANQPTSENRDDGLELIDCYMTAAVKCVPPDNRPTKQEFANCNPYFTNEFLLLKHIKAVLVLGQLAFNAYRQFLLQEAQMAMMSTFSHGLRLDFPGWPSLYTSYHPSPQNTNTGKLTETMFLTLLKRIKEEIK